MIFNLGHGGEAAGKFILERVLAHQEGTADADLEKTDAAAIDESATTTDEDGVSRD